MRLILSDIKLNLVIDYIDLSALKITNCIGCYSCWVKTPGKCIIRDDAIKIYTEIAKSTQLTYITKVKYGCYDTIMKTMLERTLPIQQAFIKLIDGETHHFQRDVKPKQVNIIAYQKQNISEIEKSIFVSLVERNSYNLNFENYNVIFTNKKDLEKCVKEVISDDYIKR